MPLPYPTNTQQHTVPTLQHIATLQHAAAHTEHASGCATTHIFSKHTSTQTAAHYNYTVPHCNVHCSTCVAMPLSRMSPQHTAIHCNTLQYTAIHCNTIQCTLQHASGYATTHIFSQQTATQWNTLQYTATHCNAHCSMRVAMPLKHIPSTHLQNTEYTGSKIAKDCKRRVAMPCHYPTYSLNTLQHKLQHKLQHTATHLKCNRLQHTLQHASGYATTQNIPPTHSNTLQQTATHYTYTATHCNYTATHCNAHCNTHCNAQVAR